MERAQPGTVRTTCPYCGVGCGVLASLQPDGSVTVAGDPDHPANFGRLCSKGAALGETLGPEDRLRHPRIAGVRASWDAALDRVAAGFSRAIADHGPDSVAFYVSGQLLTEDYYVANKLMKGFIGSANIDTNSRLCMASSVVGHRRAFGSDTVPVSYEDVERADLVVLVGANLAWCHPVLFQRIAAAKEARPDMTVVVIDPRRTVTADFADLHLAVAPDGDVALFAGLLAHLAEQGAVARDYVARHTTGFDAAVAAARTGGVPAVASACGLATDAVAAFFRLFAATQKVVTLYSQGVNQSADGTDKVNAIVNCHLATGRIGRPGAGPFSVTGQPNAMGGREVGGLATSLAAHMDLESPAHRALVRRFWRAPRIADRPGLKAVDLFRAVAEGRIRALWIMATNPVDSMPEADTVAAAIRACPFVVVSDIAGATDTLRHAHVALPAAGWGEKDGTVTNSERRISRQRPFLPPPGAARPDWWIVTQVARRMGHAEAFRYDSPAEIFAEHAALSAFENQGTRGFDIGRHAALDQAAYDALDPFQWPAPAGQDTAPARPFADGGFHTPDRKARFVPVVPRAHRVTSAAYPLVLNTGRVRDHWHTMTRTGRSARLSAHLGEPFAAIHPADARDRGIADADIVHVRSPHGEILVRALISDRQARGAVFVPMHWTDQFAARARVDTLVPAVTDPHSGQPASKRTGVALQRFAARVFGFAVTRRRPRHIPADYWSVARCAEGWRTEFAGAQPAGDGRALAAAILGATPEADMLAFRDAAAGRTRFAVFSAGRLAGAVFLDSRPVAVARQWAADQLGQAFATPHARLAVLAARPGGSTPDRGATVCACFGVGRDDIARAAAGGCTSVAAIGTALQAGTNCGSCRAEIGQIVDACRLQAAE